MTRQPTDAEYAAYDGMHCNWLWRATPEDWVCPGCGRSKRQILVWGTRKGSNARVYGPVGWKTALHKHHDHGPRDGRDFNGALGRFPAEIICGARNAVDGNIKAILKLPVSFSFSPAEIRRLIRAANNAPHQIMWAAVTDILRELQQAGILPASDLPRDIEASMCSP
jgi:hypothetical protein